MLPAYAPLTCPPVADDPEHGGGGVRRNTFQAPESVALCLGAFTCLYRSGWARRVRPGGLLGDPWECLRMFGEVPSQRVKLPFKIYSEIQQLKGLWWGRGGALALPGVGRRARGHMHLHMQLHLHITSRSKSTSPHTMQNTLSSPHRAGRQVFCLPRFPSTDTCFLSASIVTLISPALPSEACYSSFLVCAIASPLETLEPSTTPDRK